MAEMARRLQYTPPFGAATAGPVQPAVVVQQVGQSTRRVIAGKLEGHHVQGNHVVWTYSNVNGSGRLTVSWRFEQTGVWMEPVIYESSASEDVVSLNLFAEAAGDSATPALTTAILVVVAIWESISLRSRPAAGKTQAEATSA